MRRNGQTRVYANSCPHIGLPLDAMPHRFLDTRRERIVCSAHGARFRIDDGVCLSGPCVGQRLEAVPFRVVDAVLWVDE